MTYQTGGATPEASAQADPEFDKLFQPQQEVPAATQATPAQQPQQPQQPSDPDPEFEKLFPQKKNSAQQEPAGWFSKENFQNALDIGSAVTNPALALGRGAVQYEQGKDTAPAAIFHGATSMVAGDLPEKLRDAGRNALSTYLGIGTSTPADQAQKDTEFETQLQAQHPVATWGGRILGMFGLGAGAGAGEAALGTLTTGLAGKIAYSGVIGAGAGAISGFGNGGNWDDRVNAAKTGAVVGGFLGLAGGALGSWLGAKQGAAAVTAGQQSAAEKAGVNMAAPVSAQLPEYGEAAARVVPESAMTAPEVAQSLKDKGVALLRQAGTKQAIVSADGVRSIASDVMASAEAENIDIGRHFDLMSPQAKNAWSVVENLGKRAETMPPSGKIPWKDVMNDAMRINDQYPTGVDKDYQVIRSSFNKWVDNLANAEMFSGDKSALEDFGNFRKLYKAGNLVNNNTALGKIFDYAHGPQQVVNWLTAADKLGEHGPAVGLVDSLKGLLGEASPEWEALRSTAWKNIASANEATTGTKLAQRIDVLRQNPIASRLYSPEQLQGMGQFSNVLRTLPNKVAPAKNVLGQAVDFVKGHAAHGVTPAMGFLGGAGHAAWSGISAGHDPMDVAWDAIKEGATLAGTAAMAGPATRIPPAAVQYAAPAAITKAVLPEARNQPQQTQNRGGAIQARGALATAPAAQARPGFAVGGQTTRTGTVATASTKQGATSSSPSVDRAMHIARRASAHKYQQGGDASSEAADPEPIPPANNKIPDALDNSAVPEPGTPPNRLPSRFGTGEASPAMQKVTSGIGQGIAQQADIPRQVMQGTPATGVPDAHGRPMMTEEDAYRLNQTNQGASDLATNTAISMAGARAPFAEPGAAGIFGGKLSRTADQQALKTAQDLTASGATREEIWNKTGWFQGADKNWRYEIPDDKLKTNLGLGKTATQLPHPELQKAYPTSGIADVSQLPREGGATSWTRAPTTLYSADKPATPFYEIGGPNAAVRRSVAAHELQHGVQHTEGFAPGSSPILEARQAFGEDPQFRALAQRYKDAKSGGPPITGAEQAAMDSYSTQAFNLYQSSAGEVEARNVQKRLMMDPAARRATPPWNTQAIPEEQQLVRNPDWINSFHDTQRYEPQAPAIRNQNTPLFDYSRLHEVPNVPQHDIPRLVPARGVPADVRQMFDNPENVAKFNNYVDQGIKMGGPKWYNTMPLRDAFHAELGPTQGAADYARSMDYQAAASPLNTVPVQIPTGSYLYHADKSGISLPEVGRSPKGNPYLIKPPGQQKAMPEPYGSPAQALHVMNANDIKAGKWDPVQNPKPPSYSGNLQGNYQPITGDRHYWRAWGGTGDMPKKTGYGYMEDVGQAEAAKKGLAPAQYQSSGWLGAAKDTGVKTGNDPFLKMFEDAIRKKAEQLGLPPQTVLRNYIRGQQALKQGGSVNRALSVARRYQ